MDSSPKRVKPPTPVDVLGLPLRPLRTQGLIELLADRASARQRTTATYANAHTVNMSMRDAAFHRVLSESDVLYADGASLIWASRYADERLPERMTAADYFPRFARQCADMGLSIFLLGGKEGVAQSAAMRLQAEIPELKIAGVHHGHFSDDESPAVVERINAAKPDVLAVGLSSPRQEFWLAEHGDQLDVPVRWCVGALFDYLAGIERRAPQWLCRMGGEWLFRLLVDPVGKWRRYLLGNPLFVWHTWRWRARRRAGRPSPGGSLGLTRS